MLVVLDRSGGRPESDRRVLAALDGHGQPVAHSVVLIDRADQEAAIRTASSASFSFESVLTVFAYWFAYRVLFRGGWTVHVDAPGRDPIKIRCRDHASAFATARSLAFAMDSAGLQALASIG